MKPPVIEFLSWVNVLLEKGKEARSTLKKRVMDALSRFSDKGEGDPDVSAGKSLVLNLEDHFEFVGFTPNVSYVKEVGEKQDLHALFVHPFGTPTLLFKHKKLPILLITNPGIRFNESMVNEIRYNAKELSEDLKQFHENSQGIMG